MLFEFFRFELLYRAKRADTYLYFLVLFLFSVVAVDFLYEGTLDPIKRNAPVVIARTMGIVSALCMLLISMIMGVPILRDFKYEIQAILFVNPIRKRDYLFGRFLGSFLILLFIFSGLPLGMMLGDQMPWHSPEQLVPFQIGAYLVPFTLLVLPTLFFAGALFFVSGALSRKLLVVYTQGVVFLMLYLVFFQLVKGPDNTWVVSLLEPFTFQTIGLETQYWSVNDKNMLSVPFSNVLLFNRMGWITIGVLALLVGYARFRFTVKKNRKQAKRTVQKESEALRKPTKIPLSAVCQTNSKGGSFGVIWKNSLFYFRTVFSEMPFWAMVICAAGIVLISSINLGTAFGVDSYPTTYIIVGELVENTMLFFLLIIVFYSGELVWQERDINAQHISDTMPISDFSILTGKFLGLVMTFTVLILAMIVGGIMFQTSMGYYKYELDVYLSGFFVEIFPYLFLLSVVCFFFQVVINHKFFAHIIIIIFVFSATIPLKLKGIDHGLYSFGGNDLGGYSDMNGYGHFLEPYLWFKAYWIAFAVLLFLLAVALRVRGTSTRFPRRIKQIPARFTKPIIRIAAVAFILFISIGCYNFYNTNILNTYAFQSTENQHRAAYEKTLKKFEYLPQPKIVAVNMQLALYPSEREYDAEGYFVLVNPHEKPINEIHIQKLPTEEVAYEYLNFEGGVTRDHAYDSFDYLIHKLKRPLNPGDSVKMSFKQTFKTKGFSEDQGNNVVYNGSFFTNFHFPTLGYTNDIELVDSKTRRENGLGPNAGFASRDDTNAVRTGRNDGDGEEIHFEMTIGTESDQIAVTSGRLVRKWQTNDRNYFHYKATQPMSHFYAMLSAKYELAQQQWVDLENRVETPVDLEIYFHKGHEYNLDRMMKGMKESLAYYSKHFGKYQYQQLRIVEVPNYRKRAQSFPNTVPFSEDIGFILDIDDQEDVDMVFFVTAHEVAHQWWGHQVNAANVQGKAMILESLAQYSAFMVFRKNFPKEKTLQLIASQRDRYLKERGREKQHEMPLSLVDRRQDYVHYEKGLLNLYAFQDYVSADSLNTALARFVKDWNSFSGAKKTKTSRYPTTVDLIDYFRAITPDSLQYTITDLFETVTLYDNKIKTVTQREVREGHYKLSIEIAALKYRVDEKGEENVVPIDDWVDIAVFSEENADPIYLKKHRITADNMHIEVVVEERPLKVVIDPFYRLMDTDVDNNEQEVH